MIKDLLLFLKIMNVITDQDLQLLRLLTPVAKMYTAKSCVSVLSEGLECFGGQVSTGCPKKMVLCFK